MSRSFTQVWPPWPLRTPRGESGSKTITKPPTASLKSCRATWTRSILTSLKDKWQMRTVDTFEEMFYSAFLHRHIFILGKKPCKIDVILKTIICLLNTRCNVHHDVYRYKNSYLNSVSHFNVRNKLNIPINVITIRLKCLQQFPVV